MIMINIISETPGAMPLPGSPMYNPLSLKNTMYVTDGPERYMCPMPRRAPVPNPVSYS